MYWYCIKHKLLTHLPSGDDVNDEEFQWDYSHTERLNSTDYRAVWVYDCVRTYDWLSRGRRTGTRRAEGERHDYMNAEWRLKRKLPH